MREQFENRPIVLAAIAFALGIWLKHDVLGLLLFLLGVVVLRPPEAKMIWSVFCLLGMWRSPVPVPTV
ncbi:MAG: hypothetical protein ACOYON_16220, partial [Fimbriimonas sp.]